MRSPTATLAWVLCLALLTAGGLQAQAQDRLAWQDAPELRSSEVLGRDGYLVVIDLDENELHFLQGERVLWSAPVATGMGLRLETEDRDWVFDTPRGVYQVQHKEENPVWYAPDWFFIENKRPVPPRDHPSRRFPGSLGEAAVYIGRGLAIHGTDKPDLLGQRVSHGCIRLSNQDARRLYHNVQRGTKVVIVGGEDMELDERGVLVPGRVPGTEPVDRRTERLRERAKAAREQLRKELEAQPTPEVIERLEAALASRSGTADEVLWTDIASDLIRRARTDGDTDAARGMLDLAARADFGSRGAAAEYRTFLADLYNRAPRAATSALGSMRRADRTAAAGMIVEGMIGLFAGGPEDRVAPWPSQRVPRRALDAEGERGLDALQAAERTYRSNLASRTTTRRGR